MTNTNALNIVILSL